MQFNIQTFPLNGPLYQGPIQKLNKSPEIISFDESPLLAALCTCLGIQKEMGIPSRDRLSFPLGIDLTKYQRNPWRSEIILLNGQIALQLWIDGVEEFHPRHPDFGHLLHPAGLDEHGRLAKIILAPVDIYHRYKKQGLELVVVRDWFLGTEEFNYFYTNSFELKNNSGRYNAELLVKCQLAFSGTHDIADHLLGFNLNMLSAPLEFYQEVLRTFELYFPRGLERNTRMLSLAYTLGVVLDDLAQPQWYLSYKHLLLAKWLLADINHFNQSWSEDKNEELPLEFHQLISHLRDRSKVDISESYQNFILVIARSSSDIENLSF